MGMNLGRSAICTCSFLVKTIGKKELGKDVRSFDVQPRHTPYVEAGVAVRPSELYHNLAEGSWFSSMS